MDHNWFKPNISDFRQAEAIAETKSEQVGLMLADLRSKETENQLLRQSLERTREALANEQRMVYAIRKSKVSFICSLILKSKLPNIFHYPFNIVSNNRNQLSKHTKE